MPDDRFYQDLVVRLEERFTTLEKRVTANSAILDRLDDYVTQAKGASVLGRALWDGGKLLVAGATGAGAWTWVQSHLPRFALAVALTVLHVKPAFAWTGWVLETEICLGSTCRPATRADYGNASICEDALAELLKSLPQGTGLTVRARCVEDEPRA